jgi:hypothetical protein
VNSSLQSEGQNSTEILKGVGAHLASDRGLSQLIRGSLQHYGGSPEAKMWLPFDKLFEFVNESAVYRELEKAFEDKLSQDTITKNTLKSYAEKICNCMANKHQVNNESAYSNSSRSIFAILTLMEKVCLAPAFVDAGIKDIDLPLSRRFYPPAKGYKFYSSFEPNKTLEITPDWKDHEVDSFINYQDYMLSPFFVLKRTTGIVPLYELDNNAVLPFTQVGNEVSDYHGYHGYHGSVLRVKIHPAHIDTEVCRCIRLT